MKEKILIILISGLIVLPLTTYSQNFEIRVIDKTGKFSEKELNIYSNYLSDFLKECQIKVNEFGLTNYSSDSLLRIFPKFSNLSDECENTINNIWVNTPFYFDKTNMNAILRIKNDSLLSIRVPNLLLLGRDVNSEGIGGVERYTGVFLFSMDGSLSNFFISIFAPDKYEDYQIMIIEDMENTIDSTDLEILANQDIEIFDFVEQYISSYISKDYYFIEKCYHPSSKIIEYKKDSYSDTLSAWGYLEAIREKFIDQNITSISKWDVDSLYIMPTNFYNPLFKIENEFEIEIPLSVTEITNNFYHEKEGILYLNIFWSKDALPIINKRLWIIN